MRVVHGQIGGFKVKQQVGPRPFASAADERQFVNAAWPCNPLEQPHIKRWQLAARMTLIGLFTYAGLQYYFFDVYLTIMAMPSVTLPAGLP